MKSIVFPILTCAALVVLSMSGCTESGPVRHKTVGTITFDGQPVAEGEILFKPTGEGMADMATIKDGKYEMLSGPGPKRVEISARRENGVAPDGLPNYESYIPAQYNANSTLTTEVKPNNDNKADFALTSK